MTLACEWMDGMMCLLTLADHYDYRHKVFTNDLNANGYGKYAAQHYYQTDIGGPYDNDALQGMLKDDTANLL